MLRALALRNFQAHHKLKIVFDRHITTIKGPTDVGKSSVLRALEYVCLNSLTGSDFITEGKTDSGVKLSVRIKNKRFVVLRLRKGRINIYGLKTEDSSKRFKAFGQTVPEEIAALLRVNELNFQRQHDAPFWFSLSASEVSRRLNVVIDLSVIDSSLSNIGTEVRRNQERVAVSDERLKELNAELEKLEPQRIRIKEFERLKARNEKLEQFKTDSNRLDSLVIAANQNQTRQLRDKAADIEAVFKLAQNARRLQTRHESLQNLIEDYVEQKQLSLPVPSFGRVEAARKRLEHISRTLNNLANLIAGIEQLEDEIALRNETLERIETTVHHELKDARCPVCGSKL
jgi:DNA repair exonuclease SbcCD ATPase subunit